jgi:hypothetical protein
MEVVRDGKPAVGATVRLRLQDVALQETWARERTSWIRDEVMQLVAPQGKTDARGIVRFQKLIPGRYEIAAAAAVADRRILEMLQSGRLTIHLDKMVIGVAVQRGNLTRHRLAIYERNNKTDFQVFRPDGRPLELQSAHMGFSAIGAREECHTRTKLDEDGRGSFLFDHTGLWQLDFKFRETLIMTGPIDPPYDQASGFVAVSPLFRSARLARFHGVNIALATLTVRLQDAAGKPLQGTLELVAGAERSTTVRSTDAQGIARFVGQGVGTYEIRADVAGLAPLEHGDFNVPLPDDAALKFGQAILPKTIMPLFDGDVAVVLKPEPVGYIRGVLKPPAGKTCSEYVVGAWSELQDCGASRKNLPATGEFVLGPFPPGKALVRVLDLDVRTVVVQEEIAIQAGQVARMEIHAPVVAPVKPPESDQVYITMGGKRRLASIRDVLKGRVTMPGGKTPAMGAMVCFFDAGCSQPILAGITDPAGNIHGQRRRYSGAEGTARLDDSNVAAVVALLPGTCGAVVAALTLDKPLELVLPAPQSLRGKVTVAGSKAVGHLGHVRVAAAHLGKGRLEGLLNVQASADADGRFTLSGLSPGTYKVQAVLDDLWLSESCTIAAGGGPISDVNLVIGAPGAASEIVVTDVAGMPLSKQLITLDRPDGPLAAECWPAEWRTDGAGRVYIPTLEAGTHHFHLRADGTTHTLTVPPLPTDDVKETRVQVRHSAASQ